MDKTSNAYKKAKAVADRKFKEKTSAYKSLYISKKYKEYGGKYKNHKTKNRSSKNLQRWLKEKWIRVSPKTGTPMKKNGKLVPCGRSKTEIEKGVKKGLCRPYKKISRKSPKTAKELGKKEMKRRTSLKKKYPNRVIRQSKKNNMQNGGASKVNNKKKPLEDLYKQFKPNLTPKQIFSMGSFGGTYWRPIKHKGKLLKNQHKKYKWGISDNKMTKDFKEYDKSINKYKKKVGTTLAFWRQKGWMKDQDPYGWVQWYAEYNKGRRSPDDERQIKRWLQLTGPKGRFRKWLITMIMKKGGPSKWDDETISPAIRQTLQHWGYKLTKKDFDKELKERRKK
jgi:hypothetical protein